ncbi:hypothetical protein ABZ372_29300, partial [Streptomyces sp. NPDC005921]
MTTSPQGEQHDAPALTEIETYGVERIPDADRTARPLDLFRVAFGGANTFATCVLGAGLGVGGHLTALRRTRVGPYKLDS